MIPSFVSWAPRVLVCAVLFSAGAAYGQVNATLVVPSNLPAGSVCTSFVFNNASGPTVTCANWSGPSAFSCSASASPATIASGGSSTLTMTCSGGTAPYSYSLTGGAQGQTSNKFVVSPTATTTYSLTATDAAPAQASSGPQTTKVTVSPGGGGSGGPISCSGNGITGTQTATLTWGGTGASKVVPAGVNDAIVIQFTAGNTSHASALRGFEYGSSASFRTGVLSTTPCDFTGSLPYASSANSTTISAMMAVAPIQGGGGTFLVPLVNGTTYYWNIRTAPDAACGASNNCQMKFSLSP